MSNTKALNELESAKLLNSYGINMVQSVVLHSADEIDAAAETLGFPVVMKVLSDDILHKTDAGCVMLDLHDAASMKTAYTTILANAKAYAPEARIQGVLAQQMLPKGLEVLLGVSTDPQFGPVVMVGLGGILVELLNATSVRILPITRDDAIDMINETPLKKLFAGFRGIQYDREEVIEALLHLSDLVEKNPDIREIDINPLMLYGNGKKATGVDAMVVYAAPSEKL